MVCQVSGCEWETLGLGRLHDSHMIERLIHSACLSVRSGNFLDAAVGCVSLATRYDSLCRCRRKTIKPASPIPVSTKPDDSGTAVVSTKVRKARSDVSIVHPPEVRK